MVDLFESGTADGEFDIIGFAKNIISEINSIRSYGTQKSDNSDEQGTLKPQESRVNAFLRLLGFPMFVTITDSNNSYDRMLTPGHFPGAFHSSEIKNIDSLPLLDVEKLAGVLSGREATYLSEENEIGSERKNNAMSQSIIHPIGLVPNFRPGMESAVSLFLDPSKKVRRVFKMLFPLVTSYINVSPSKNMIARPFSSSIQSQIDASTKLKRPFIESVLTMRLVLGESAGNQKLNKSLQDFLTSVESSNKMDSEKIANILGQSGALEIYVLEKIFSSIGQISNRWSEIKAKRDYYVKKIGPLQITINTGSAKDSPFGKRISTSSEIDETTEYGIILSQLQKELDKETAYLGLLVADSFSNDSGTSNSMTSSLLGSFVDLLKSNSSQIEEKIKDTKNQIATMTCLVDQLRAEIDFMTGEFSGISILDIISVMAALFLIDKPTLIALVDSETKDIMTNNESFKGAMQLHSSQADSAQTAAMALKEVQTNAQYIFDYVNTLVSANNDRSKRPKPVSRGESSK